MSIEWQRERAVGFMSVWLAMIGNILKSSVWKAYPDDESVCYQITVPHIVKATELLEPFCVFKKLVV